MNIAAARWVVVPDPPDAYASDSGWALARAMSSASVRSGWLGVPTISRGARVMMPIGAKSFNS